jgi:hypothetical protein
MHGVYMYVVGQPMGAALFMRRQNVNQQAKAHAFWGMMVRVRLLHTINGIWRVFD